LTKLNASSQEIYFFFIRKAITVAADLETPAAQCTNTEPLYNPSEI